MKQTTADSSRRHWQSFGPTRPIEPESRYIAGVYAQAVLGAAEKAEATESVLEELEAFVSQVVDPNPEFEEFLRSGIISRETKEHVLQKTLAERIDPLVLRFLMVLNQHHRLDVLKAVVAVAREIDDRRRGRIPVEVTSAVPLNGELSGRIRDRLQTVLEKEPILTSRVDPGVMGGLVLRIEDSVYDGSLATQLRNLREQILQRSVHEIQSGRDRFRDSTGD
jgi:F-type H+-transporting ATPase subunit delta